MYNLWYLSNDLSNLPFVFKFLYHFSHTGKNKHRSINFPKLRECRKSQKRTQNTGFQFLSIREIPATHTALNKLVCIPKTVRETPSFLLLFIPHILSVKTGNLMVLNIRWTMVTMLNSLTLLMGIMDRECETAIVFFHCGACRLMKEYVTPLCQLCNSVCPPWREGPPQWPSRATPQFPFVQGGCYPHSFPWSQIAQPLQAGLHHQQAPDFLSWHSKCSSEQTRETCFSCFHFNCHRVDMGWGFTG